MGAIAAVFDKKGTDAPSTVITMLKELEHRATGTQRVVSQPSAFIAQSLGSSEEKTVSEVAVGTSGAEPVLGKNYLWVFEGQLFPPMPSTINQILHKARHQPLEIARHFIKELDGSYTFAAAFSKKLLIGRDALGTHPLYFGENKSICAVASERKALWKTGITNTQSFPPGNLAIINKSGFTFEPVAKLELLAQMKIKMIDAADHLQKLLEESTRERVLDVEEVGVAFSGGLDSSVVAFLAKLTGVSVHLICVGLEGQPEAEYAKHASEKLGLPLTLQTYTVADVENVLPRVLWLIEQPDVMKAGVAVPFFWTARIASKLGCRVLLAGQGADELFGGYHRYLTQYAEGGAEKVREALFYDTTMAYETNFQRDEPVCAYHGVELRLPFADAQVVRFALSLSPIFKIQSARDNLRKRILRQVAKNMGIPPSITNKPKKAIQFATGVDKALKKLGKTDGLTPSSYIEKVFRNVYPNVEVK